MKDINILISRLHRAQNKNDKNEEIKILFEIGIYYYDNGDFIKAKSNFNKILNINSDIIEVNYYLSLIELQDGHYRSATILLKRELLINPLNSEAKNLLEKLDIHHNFPIITITLLLLNSIVFFFTYPEISKEFLIKFALSINDFNIFSIISSTFFHINYLHFTINMFILLMFGFILEKRIDSLKFLLIYLSSAIIGNLLQAIYLNGGFVLGASAGLFGIIGALVMIEPLFNVRLFGIFKMPLILVFGGFFVISYFISNSIYFGINSGDIAHLVGFLTGLLIAGIFYGNTLRTFYHWVSISFGFYVLSMSLNYILKKRFYDNLGVFLILFYAGFGIFIIIFSYDLLKKLSITEVHKK